MGGAAHARHTAQRDGFTNAPHQGASTWPIVARKRKKDSARSVREDLQRSKCGAEAASLRRAREKGTLRELQQGLQRGGCSEGAADSSAATARISACCKTLRHEARRRRPLGARTEQAAREKRTPRNVR